MNCARADLPCVYPAPDSGVKKKRGPYKKDKPARERHLEDLVKYLEPNLAISPGHKDDGKVHSPQLDTDGGVSTCGVVAVADT